MDRWTIDQLKKISDIDFAIAILNERGRKVSPYSPLGVKLKEVQHRLNRLSESTTVKVIIKNGAVVDVLQGAQSPAADVEILAAGNGTAASNDYVQALCAENDLKSVNFTTTHLD